MSSKNHDDPLIANADIFVAATDLKKLPFLMDKIRQRDLTGLITISRKMGNFDLYDPTTELTPLIYAVEQQWLEGVKVLIEVGANASFSLPESNALVSAVKSHNMEIIETLLNAGADPNGRGCLESPLNIAVWQNNIRLAKYLLDSGADVNRGSSGGTPLMWAVLKDNLSMIQVLVEEYGADVNLTIDDDTALIVAVHQGNREIVEYLLPLITDPAEKKYAEEKLPRSKRKT